MKNTRLLTIFAILILSLVLTTGVLAAASMAGKHYLMKAANPAFSGKSPGETFDFQINSSKPDSPEITGLDLISSTNKFDWSAVDGSMGEGFRMTLDPEVTYHYLDSDLVTSNKTLAEGLHGFYVETVPDHEDFFKYWNGRGVNKDTTNEISGTLWDIITGTLPTFYLNVEGVNPEEQTFGLVDGLLQATGTNDGGDVFWRVYGDYPTGLYTYSGTITDTQNVTNTQTVSITFEAPPPPEPGPVFLPIILNNYSAPLFFDTFDFDRGWNQVSDSGASSRVQDGQLVITQTVANRNVRTVAPFEASKIPEFFAVEADMEIVPGFHLGTKYGLLFNWIDADHFYRDASPVFLPVVFNDYSPPIFYDPFDTDKSWTIISSGGYDYEIFGGEYYITQTLANRNVKSIAPVTSAEIPSQYVIEADMRLPDGSNDETRYGLIFDFVNANRFYMFYVSPKNQQWWIYKFNSGWSEIDSSTSANTNINQTGNNHLKIERNGDQINAYVKGYELGPWSPHSDFTGNQAGLVLISSISLSGGESAVAAYDNFLITDLYP